MVLLLRMGNKAIVNKVLKVVDQHNVQRFKCEQTHKGLELGDLTEGWDVLEKQMIWTYQYKCDSLDGLKRNLASCKECRGWNIIADPEVKPYCSIYAGYEVVELIDYLNGKEKELPLDALVVGRGNTIADVIKKYDRLNPEHKKERERKRSREDAGW